MEHESDVYTNCNRYSWYSYQRMNKGTRELGNKRKRGAYPNESITEINQNIEKSPGDLRRLAVTQTPVKDSQGVNMKIMIMSFGLEQESMPSN